MLRGRKFGNQFAGCGIQLQALAPCAYIETFSSHTEVASSPGRSHQVLLVIRL